ncbi:MAG: pantoate kinase [Candidatus Helarchaeota archaeon]
MIFSIRDQANDLLKKGSIGVGFSIDKGVKTTISLKQATSKKLIIKINGKESNAPVTRAVIDKFPKISKESMEMVIEHVIDFPVSAGFGASGAGALSTALALNELSGNIYDNLTCGQIAHEAEIINSTGLGDVIAQYYGGFEIRVKEGAPGIGQIRRLKMNSRLKILLGTWGVLETKKVLLDENQRKRIINHGEVIINKIIQENIQDLNQLCKKAQEFSSKTNLESREIKSLKQILIDNGFTSHGMVMLGNSFFCFITSEELDKLKRILNGLPNRPYYFLTNLFNKSMVAP